MQGASARSLYIDPALPLRPARACEVLQVTPLLRHLLIEAARVPADYRRGERGGALFDLLLHEIGRAEPLSLHVPLPASAALSALCRQFLRAPDIRTTADEWARRLCMSRRSLNRAFRRETGITLRDWRQRACVVAALSRLEEGTPVTAVALDQGYDGPAAFSTMFRRVLAEPPSVFARR